jgi:hypothetical protein
MSGFRSESYEGIRQYDIWIDGQKLTADFLPDMYTQVGQRLLLGFGEGRVLILDHESTYQDWIDRTDPQENYAQLNGKRIEFRLQDDVNGRWVLISTCDKLQWAVRFDSGMQGPLEPFPISEGRNRIQCPLMFGRTYVFQVTPKDDSSPPTTMTLCVTDPLTGMEVGDSRSPSPVLEAPDEPPSEAVLDWMRRILEKRKRVSPGE